MHCGPTTQGQFDLNELRVGEGAVLRRNTRLLSGASMDAYSMMLENTLVVSGDVLGAGTVWQVCTYSQNHRLWRNSLFGYTGQ